MRASAGVLARARFDLADETAAALAAIARREPAALGETPELAEAYLSKLGADRFRAGPAFIFPTDPPATMEVVEIRPENAQLLLGGLGAWRDDVGRRGPFLAIVRDGRAVSLCASVRITRHVHCAGVETDPAWRGRGLAGAVVAAWAACVRALGATPFYSTSWENLASRGVARRFGLELAAVDFSVD